MISPCRRFIAYLPCDFRENWISTNVVLREVVIMKKILLCFIIFVLFVSTITVSVGASSYRITADTSLLRNLGWTNGGSKNAGLSYLEINGEPAFCLEIDEEILLNNSGHIASWEDVGVVDNNLKRRLSLIVYFGYRQNPSLHAYAMTQLLIWDELARSGLGKYPYSTSNTTAGYSTNYISSWKSNIIGKVNNYLTGASFDGMVLGVAQGESINIAETNGVLSSLVIVNNSGLDVKKESNNLMINIPHDYSGENIKILLNKPFTIASRTNFLAVQDGGRFQVVSPLWHNDTLLASLNIQKKETRIKIVKTGIYTEDFISKEELIPYIKFHIVSAEDVFTITGEKLLSKGEIVEELITDEKGEALSRDLHYGKYEIHELEYMDMETVYTLTPKNIGEIVDIMRENNLLEDEESEIKLMKELNEGVYKQIGGDAFKNEILITSSLFEELLIDYFDNLPDEQKESKLVTAPFNKYVLPKNSLVDTITLTGEDDNSEIICEIENIQYVGRADFSMNVGHYGIDFDDADIIYPNTGDIGFVKIYPSLIAASLLCVGFIIILRVRIKV